MKPTPELIDRLYRTALKYLEQNRLPKTGVAYFFRERIFGWSRALDQPSKVRPGVIALELETGQLWIATKADNHANAKEWTHTGSRHVPETNHKPKI